METGGYDPTKASRLSDRRKRAHVPQTFLETHRKAQTHLLAQVWSTMLQGMIKSTTEGNDNA